MIYGSKLCKSCKNCNDYYRKKDERHNRGEIKDEWYLTRKMENWSCIWPFKMYI